MFGDMLDARLISRGAEGSKQSELAMISRSAVCFKFPKLQHITMHQ